ncbi:glycosyl hydrolase [Plectosphaerella plurivora]|uniref:Glycosyl hydrolase n=1 Tax=Plectosphaerella plurivora TaxID=936078 RepID=A0A9P8V158_9PEZI|nr:glycosyl hydrolase [Plectosphaerella plurivora]
MKLLRLLSGALLGHAAVAAAGKIQKRCGEEGDTFKNPVIYSDFPDNDIFRGPDDKYYFSASNFHYSPGAPILRSDDLVNWDIIGHSIPRMTFGDNYDLPLDGSAHAYRGGTWASTMRYRESNGLWYWVGCTNFWVSWVFTAPDPTGPWSNRGAVAWNGTCYYDNGLLIDDDDTMYVVFGSNDVRVAQMSEDGLQQVRMQSVLNRDDVGADGLEGNRLYKINGTYYILNDRPGGTTYIWKSDNIWGPYESKILIQDVTPPLAGGNSPHQGSLIETPNGWYYMSFTWAYPAGRLPVLAPITWGDDGFPVFVKGENGGWGTSYPLPFPNATGPAKNWDRTDTFPGTRLHPSWEFNHNPDEASYTVNNGLTLRAASVTQDIYRARNTITHRTHGEFPVGTAEIDFSRMAPGDRAGLAAFRDQTAYIGVHRDGNSFVLAAKHGMVMNEWDGTTESLGEVKATQPLPSGTTKIWLRAALDTRPTGDRSCVFSYSLDGTTFEPFGPTYTLYSGWAFFIAYRFGIFNYATEAMGGSISVESFTAE